jgi:xanthine dehydrogenase accessory factor
VLVTELAQPLAVRRTVSFAQAVYSGSITVEEITARAVNGIDEAGRTLRSGDVPVLVDKTASCLGEFSPDVLVDARMRKAPPETGLESAPLVAGLGPGFQAGVDCHAVIETARGPRLGRVYWSGSAHPDTGIPDHVAGYTGERVLRAPVAGVIEPLVEIGDLCQKGDVIARINVGEGSVEVVAAFDGLLRGLLHGGLSVPEGMKIGDLDPRGDPSLCWIISDKALAIGGGVLEAVLTWAAGKKRD